MDVEQHKERFLSVMEVLGFDDPFLEQYYDLFVNEGMDNYQFAKLFDFEEGRMLCKLVLIADEHSLPYFKGVHAVLLKTHPISHGVFNGIDTLELENQMKVIDWNSQLDELPKIFGKITELKISGNKFAKDVAERLEVRYWSETAVAKHIKLNSIQDKFARFHLFDFDDPLGVLPVRYVYNLLCGRALMGLDLSRLDPLARSYFSLQPKPPLGYRSPDKSFTEVNHPEFDLKTELGKYPLKDMQSLPQSSQLMYDLTRGNIAEGTLLISGNDYPVRIALGGKTLALHVVDKRNNLTPIDRFIQKVLAWEVAHIKRKGKNNGI
ncbi:hypothetical protein FXV77_05190 [Sphingobacterium phlebotomi]|uniref:Uncharacterized protein n=1 Tax=Sphingobacterium phlebotomi TaxID=2605433 RepID=A0A5D4HAP8_9SPHI|nr:hypothetical protein [Sphingobacterium phlebotomi]TYR37402.1 hypothetical protein FXV77_05190 [Sphingobacterium phlebotomi]